MLRPVLLIAAGVLLVAGLLVRWAVRNFVAGDYRLYIAPWISFIRHHGGFEAMAFNFSNYNPPYLYLLDATTHLPVREIIAVKAISVAFDLLLAVIGYLIVRREGRSTAVAAVAGAAMFVAPTILLNSAAWGQCDSIYAAFCAAALLFVLRREPWWACIALGTAVAFKLQAVFIAPVILLGALRTRARALIAVPLVFLAWLVPAWVAGRSIGSLADIYPQQMALPNPPAWRTGTSPYTFFAPTFYQWLSPTSGAIWALIGYALVGCAVLAAAVLVYRRPDVPILPLAVTTTLLICFTLPHMHDRYFYLCDALTIALAFTRPWYAPTAIAVQLGSLAAYGNYLEPSQFHHGLLKWAAVAMALGTAWAVGRFVRDLRRTSPPGVPRTHREAVHEGPVPSEPPAAPRQGEEVAVTMDRPQGG